MTESDLKKKLAAYRGDSDAEDEFFASALDQVRKDPALAQWLRDSQQFDERVRAALRTTPFPHDLRERILEQAARPDRTIEFFPRKPGLPALMALAALVVISLTLMPLWLGKGSQRGPAVESLAAFVHEIIARDGIALAATGIPLPTIRQWLDANRAPSGFDIPPMLNPDAVVGCQKYVVDGHAVTLVCFEVDDGSTIHMFVTRTARGGNGKKMMTRDGLAMFTWTEGNYRFLLADPKGKEHLQNLLPTMVSCRVGHDTRLGYLSQGDPRFGNHSSSLQSSRFGP